MPDVLRPQQLLAAILELTDEAVLTIGIDGIIEEWSPGARMWPRYGGDECGLVLVDSDLEMAQQVARRIAARLPKDAEEPQLSVRIGIGRFPDDGRNAQELLEVADRQLYQQKKSKRPESRPTLALAVHVEGATISEVAVIILPNATIPGTNGWQRFRMLQNPDIARRFAQ
jgi:GGDEF domain-containing protein